ncbi:uncharacterized protein PgNI_11521 [Pyricularia grisea]|uniref:Peptidase S33 tripeptidyl aminopeptidase-like C-terminal domain-containing protein n=1 Tax=Pyricularia grisea TaxID=148305 RepID=A0A6P8AND4_PYRGI|nr:uncharacterized protein PgNI_11521 [Pyricularia grisea]TLD03544.1 hypothetical protein PgNI_11521 [Pyricularia grisea]
MAYTFSTIKPSPHLTWTQCFDGFTCAKLQVPLDYSNKSIGTTSIAFIRWAGKNATENSQSIMAIPGGPGGSGIEVLLGLRDTIGQMYGEQYNFVSFDPRGVNNSGPSLDCFSGDTEARATFKQLHYTGTTNASTSSLREQYYSSSIYGQRCNEAVGNNTPYGYYVTTPAVARDLLTFVEAEAELAGKSPQDAKLWCYAGSYGTITGTTFATMFPDRIGRMILDGVMDPEQYYDNNWLDTLDQADETMERFSTLCHAAGPDACSFWGPTPDDITARMDALIHQLQNHPVPISRAEGTGLPSMVTYSDLKALLLQTIYNPLQSFPILANILHQVERGNVSALVGMFDSSIGLAADAGRVIRCADSHRRNRLNTIEAFEDYTEHLVSQSKYAGDMFAIYVDTILCTSMQPRLPDSMVVQGPIKLDRPTSFPILFTSNVIDALTPLKFAREVSSRFPGSVLLLQEAIGHTVLEQGGSNCYFGHIQAYLQGVVPPTNITCPQQYFPFIDGAV